MVSSLAILGARFAGLHIALHLEIPLARMRHPETHDIYPPTAQVAYHQAPIAAANIGDSSSGRPAGVADRLLLRRQLVSLRRGDARRVLPLLRLYLLSTAI